MRDVADATGDDNLAGEYLRRVVESAITADELPAAADASHRLTTAYGESDRFLSRPGFLSLAVRLQLELDLARLHELLTGRPDRLLGGRLDEYCRSVGITPAQADIAYRTMSPPGAPTQLARADLYHDGTSFRLLEYNLTIALGGFDNAEPARAPLAAPALREFAAGHALAFPGLLADADELVVTLDSPSADPGVARRRLAPLYAGAAGRIRPGLGWTDVGRLARPGMPAVNFGRSDPELAHGPSETVTGAEMAWVHDRLVDLAS